MNAQELTIALEAAQTGEPKASVESAIAIYQAAAVQIDAMNVVKEAAKKLIEDVMTETGETSYATRAGKVAITAPSASASYDTRALDALCASSPEIAAILAPHRKETQRAGTMRITAAK